MPEYFFLFNAVSAAISALEELRTMLVEAQQTAEDEFISRPE